MGLAETTFDKIYDVLDGVSAGYYYYPRHNVAALLLPAVTAEVVSNVPVSNEGAIESSDKWDYHEIAVSVRVHTDYSGGVQDVDAQTAIMDLVITALRQNIDLGDGYRIRSWGNEVYGAEFVESASLGAETLVRVRKIILYTQT